MAWHLVNLNQKLREKERGKCLTIDVKAEIQTFLLDSSMLSLSKG